VSELPIVDAHQHFWDLERNYLPWLCDEPMIPFRYGDYSALRRSYLPRDYFRDAAGYDVVKTVYVETEWDPQDFVGETRWLQEIIAETGFPHAIVAGARLDAPDVEAVLAGHAAWPRVRGVRHKPRAAPAPEHVQIGARGSMADPAWRRGYALLAKYGLSFDLQTPWWHLSEAAQLARDFPETQIILNHTGLPADRSAAGLAGWRRAMETLAAVPNVALKISGLGQPGEPGRLRATARLCAMRSVFSGSTGACSRAIFRSIACAPTSTRFSPALRGSRATSPRPSSAGFSTATRSGHIASIHEGLHRWASSKRGQPLLRDGNRLKPIEHGGSRTTHGRDGKATSFVGDSDRIAQS
jgi:predicted TIM-barrel fold metal-dependent hydrolase